MDVEPPDGYRQRREEIAAQAAGPSRPPTDITYTPVEDGVWAQVAAALDPEWERHASRVLLEARDRLGLSRTRVPQLREVTEVLEPASGYRMEAAAGLVPPGEFFGGLAEGRFLSTQYVRWEGSPLYTPEPDVIHEIVGHGHLLVCPRLARLHRLAGEAMGRMDRPESRQFVADVFWFSAEFGVVREAGGWRAYGAGLLSSVGELGWFAGGAEIRPLDVAMMGTLPYDISRYQPVLFGADDLDEVVAVVGGFYEDCTDESIAALVASISVAH